MDLQVQRLQEAERGFLSVRQVPRVLEPDIAGAGQDALVLLFLLGNFLTPDLVHGLGELSNDVELVEDQSRLRSLSLDSLDVGRPHVATDADKSGSSLGAEEVKERG